MLDRLRAIFVCFSLLITTHSDAASAYAEDEQIWTVPPEHAERQNPIPLNETSFDQGKELYQEHCMACHGVNADGVSRVAGMLYPKPSNLRFVSGKFADGVIFYKIRNGRGLMPEWGSVLTEIQIWHLVNYIQSLSISDDHQILERLR